MQVKPIHLNAKVMQRSKGKSSTAAAAYRSGEKLVDHRTGQIHDYTRKRGVGENWIIGFSGSRSELWNLAEASERRKDATTAREFDVALPAELSTEDRVDLARRYSKWLHQKHGCAVDVCIHNLNSHNPHAHIMMTTRSIDPDGEMSKEKIAREWSDTKRKKHGLPGRKAELENDRAMWADASNYMLKRAGITDVKYDHRSYERQGSPKKPTKHHGNRDTLAARLIRNFNEAAQRFNALVDQMAEEKRYENHAYTPEPAPDPVPAKRPEPVKKPKPKKKPELSPNLTQAHSAIMADFQKLQQVAKATKDHDRAPFDPRPLLDWEQLQKRAQEQMRRWAGLTTHTRPSNQRSRDLGM